MASYSDRYGIEVDVTNSVSNLDKLQKSVEKINSIFGGLSRQIAQLGLTAFVADTIGSAKALDDFSRSSGIALQSLIGFTSAIKANGASQDQAIDAIGQFNAKLKEAASGGKEAQDAFLKVGITLNDLKTLSGEALLKKAFEGLSKNRDDVSRLGQQMGLFGESFRIVDTSLSGVVSRLDEMTASAGENASSVKSAAEAYRSFERAVSVVKDVVLMTIQPVTDLIGKLEVKTETVSGILKIASAFLLMQKVVMPLIELWYGYSKAVLAGAAAQTTFAGVTAAAMSPIKLLGAFVAEMSASFKILFEVWAVQGMSAASKLMVALGALAGLAGRLAVLTIAIIGINDAIKGLTNFDPIDTLATKLYNLSNSLFPNATKAIDDFGKKLGMASYEETQAAKSTGEHIDAKGAQADAIRTVQDALGGEKAQLDSLIKQYQLQNKLSNDRYRLETSLINASEQRAETERQLAEVDTTYQQERLKLLDQIAAKQRSTSPSDQAMVSSLNAALGELDAEYQKQRASVEELANARVKANQSYQLELFNTESLVNANRQLAEIKTQIATAILPEQAKREAELEAQALATANAAIAAEEARRKSTLSEAERNKYLEAARVKIDELKVAEEQLAEAQQKRRLIDFGTAREIENQKRLREIQQDMATKLLPERVRLAKDLAFQIDEVARAEIAAEEARRGPGYKMSADEAQKYYDAARVGLQAINDETLKNYDTQRSWSFGWEKAFRDYADNAMNAAEVASDVFSKATKGMEDAIVNFVKTGKFEWKGFVNSILEELLRAQIQSTMASIFGPILGGGSKSSGGGSLILSGIKGLGSLLGFADGGVIPTNGPVIVGERGPEILTGAAGKTVIPNEQAFGTSNVVYNINAVDAPSFKQMIAADPTFLFAVTEQGRRRLPGAR